MEKSVPHGIFVRDQIKRLRLKDRLLFYKSCINWGNASSCDAFTGHRTCTVCVGFVNNAVLRHSSWIRTSSGASTFSVPLCAVLFYSPRLCCRSSGPLPATTQTPPFPERPTTSIGRFSSPGLLFDTTCQLHLPISVKCERQTQAMRRRGRGWSTKFYLNSLWLKCEGTHCPVIRFDLYLHVTPCLCTQQIKFFY